MIFFNIAILPWCFQESDIGSKLTGFPREIQQVANDGLLVEHSSLIAGGRSRPNALPAYSNSHFEVLGIGLIPTLFSTCSGRLTGQLGIVSLQYF